MRLSQFTTKVEQQQQATLKDKPMACSGHSPDVARKDGHSVIAP